METNWHCFLQFVDVRLKFRQILGNFNDLPNSKTNLSFLSESQHIFEQLLNFAHKCVLKHGTGNFITVIEMSGNMVSPSPLCLKCVEKIWICSVISISFIDTNRVNLSEVMFHNILNIINNLSLSSQ